jgi:hypothetical protein
MENLEHGAAPMSWWASLALRATGSCYRTLRILRVVSSRMLDCGCLVGVYETFAGGYEEIVDAKGGRCPLDEHRPGRSIACTD